MLPQVEYCRNFDVCLHVKHNAAKPSTCIYDLGDQPLLVPFEYIKYNYDDSHSLQNNFQLNKYIMPKLIYPMQSYISV